MAPELRRSAVVRATGARPARPLEGDGVGRWSHSARVTSSLLPELRLAIPCRDSPGSTWPGRRTGRSHRRSQDQARIEAVEGEISWWPMPTKYRRRAGDRRSHWRHAERRRASRWLLQVDHVKDVSTYGLSSLAAPCMWACGARSWSVAFPGGARAGIVRRRCGSFSSGPSQEGRPSAIDEQIEVPRDAQKPIAGSAIHTRSTALFHGALNPAKLNLPEKLILKGVKAPIGDFRDFEAVRAWGRTIAAALKQQGG